jgi:hypothetical protein
MADSKAESKADYLVAWKVESLVERWIEMKVD